MHILTNLALSSRPITIFLMLLVLVAGTLSYLSLRQDLYPDYDYPFVTVVTPYPSANPRTVEQEVTDPLEDAILGASGIKQVQSTSAANQSLIMVEFEFDQDMAEAERLVQSRVNGVTLPPGVADPVVRRIGSEMVPVLQLSVVSSLELPELERVIDDVLLPQIEQVEGVSRAEMVGSIDDQIQVIVDIDKLDDLGLSLDQVSAAIRRNHQSIPAGSQDDRGQSFPVLTLHELGSLKAIENLVVGYELPPGMLNQMGLSGKNRPVRVRDIAEVRMDTADAATLWRTDSRPSIGVNVFKDPDHDTIKMTSSVLRVLDAATEELPDLSVVVMKDDGADAREQISGLVREGVVGFFLAVAVVFLFLVNLRPSAFRGLALGLRPTLVIALSIPLSTLLGILVLKVSGQTLNFMTIAGLAIAVGRLVDDSIVVLENLHSHIQRGEDRLTAAREATREVASAIVGTTVTTIVAFLPLALVIPGMVSTLFTPLIIALSGALMGSTLVALTVVPVAGAMLLTRQAEGDDTLTEPDSQDRLSWLQRGYTPVLALALRHKLLTLLATGLVTLASLALVLVIPIRLFPSSSPGFLLITLDLPSGTSVGRTFQELQRVEQTLDELRDQGLVEHYQAAIGRTQDVFGFPGNKVLGLNFASMRVRLGENLPVDIVQRVRDSLELGEDTTLTVSGVRIDSPPEADLEINISGKDIAALSSLAQEAKAKLTEIDGVLNVNSDLSEARDEVVVRGDPDELARLGLDTSQLGQQVYQHLVGLTITQVDWEGEILDLVVKGSHEDVDEIDEIKNLVIVSPLGNVRLGSVSEISIEQGPVSISHFDGERSVTLTGNIVAEDVQAVGWQVRSMVSQLEVPPGVEIRTLGIFQQIIESFQDLIFAIGVGVVLIYIFLMFSTRSLKNPLVILTSLPLAVVGGLVALAVTGRTISLSSLMGVLTLAGVVVDNAIVLIFFVDELRSQGLVLDNALLRGGQSRVRPIVMTALTTTIALVPLATGLSSEGGSIIGAELATVVIGGLISSTFLTLIVVPVVYAMYYETVPRAGVVVKDGAFACCAYCYNQCKALFTRSHTTDS